MDCPNIRADFIALNFQEKKIQEKTFVILSKEFFGMAPKVQTIKENIDKSDFNKIKIFHTSIKKLKR